MAIYKICNSQTVIIATIINMANAKIKYKLYNMYIKPMIMIYDITNVP